MANIKLMKCNFGHPGLYAVARNRAAGDMAAGLLLFRVMWRWRSDKKLSRLGKEWIAMSRSNWASESGLTEGEMKNRALPILRDQPFMTIRGMKLGDKKLLWISLDEGAAFESTAPWDWYDQAMNGHAIGHHPVAYPYQETFKYDKC